MLQRFDCMETSGSGFTVAAENINDLMGHHIMHSLTGGLQILTGIEMIRMLSKVLTDDSGHCKTDIRVDVDLANCAACSLTELLLGDADSTGHISAVFVDDFYEFLRN